MMDPEKKSNISSYITQAVYESRSLISYVARHSPAALNPEATEILIKFQYMVEEKKWGPEDEIRFWNAYDAVASSIKPVTIESLRATTIDSLENNNDEGPKKKKVTEAAASVSRYRIFTAFTLILLLVAQIYWINGSDLTVKLATLFSQIEDATVAIEKRKQDKNLKPAGEDIEINALNNKQKALIQEFGATYQLLQNWNRVWQVFFFQKQFSATITNYVQNQYEEDIADMRKQISASESALATKGIKQDIIEASRDMIKKLQFEMKKRTFEHEFDKERNKLFLTRISAEFVIRSLQIYVLPLLYGLLGAIIYTLRNLALEIKNLTYTHHSETKYRLRITMGLLGGMAIGWFLKPDDLGVAGSLSPMALSFLIGYNVEVLFAIMDKFIEMISKFTPAAQEKKIAPEQEKKIET